MFAFVVAELREWRELRMRRSLLISAALLGASACISLLQPLVLAFTASLIFLGLGWTEGNRYQSALSSRRLLLSFPAGSPAVACGKALSSLCIWALTLLFLSPPLALSALAWGLGARAILLCLLSWLVGFLVMLGAGFISSLVFLRSEGLPGGALMLVWLLSPLLYRDLAPSNPFFQVWESMKAEGGLGPLAGMGATLLAACAIMAVSALVLSGLRRSWHG
jgi:hypothetical protein